MNLAERIQQYVHSPWRSDGAIHLAILKATEADDIDFVKGVLPHVNPGALPRVPPTVAKRCGLALMTEFLNAGWFFDDEDFLLSICRGAVDEITLEKVRLYMTGVSEDSIERLMAEALNYGQFDILLTLLDIP